MGGPRGEMWSVQNNSRATFLKTDRPKIYHFGPSSLATVYFKSFWPPNLAYDRTVYTLDLISEFGPNWGIPLAAIKNTIRVVQHANSIL